MADESNTISVRPDLVYSNRSYIPLRFRRKIGFSKVIHTLNKSLKFKQRGRKDRIGNVKVLEMKWPDENERERIVKWCRREDIYRAFGSKRPPAADYIRRSRLPNGSGSFEPVEFLMVRDHSTHRPIGFFIVYEVRHVNQIYPEIDFALTEDKLLGSAVLIRHIKICILSYLFIICGALLVKWQRVGKKAPVEESHEELKRLLEREVRMGGPDSVPTIWMQHTKWIQA